jgi:WD40 repeat protein
MQVVTNDFVRSTYEIDAPNRRGALNAASVLQHLPEHKFRELGKRWGRREVRIEDFVELLVPVVTAAGFFDGGGHKIQTQWADEGWECDALSGAGIITRDNSPTRFSPSPVQADDDGFETPQSLPVLPTELQKYLADVFGFIDVNRKGVLSWEEFTMFLVNGISGCADSATVVTSSDEDSIKYAFSGEIKLAQIGNMNKDMLRHAHFYQQVQYAPDIDSLLCVMPHHLRIVNLATPLATHQRQPEVVLDAGTTSPLSAATHAGPIECTVAANHDREWSLWHHGRNNVKQAIRRQSMLPHATVSAMLWAHGKLWGGTQHGSLFSTGIENLGPSKYEFGTPETFKAHSDTVTSLLALPHNTSIVSSSLDSNLYLFDATSHLMREKAGLIYGHRRGILCTEFSENYTVFLSGGFDDKVHVWADNLAKAPVFSLSDVNRPFQRVIGIKAIPSTPYVAIGDGTGSLKLFDLRKRAIVHCMSVTDDENFDAGLIRRDHMRHFGENASQFFLSMEYTGTSHRQLVFGGSRLYNYGMSSDLHVSPLLTYDVDTPAVNAFSTDNSFWTVSTEECTAWSAKNGMPDMRRRKITRSIITIAKIVGQGEKKLVLGHRDGVVTVHDISTGIQLREFVYHETAVTGLAVRDGKGPATLVTCSKDGYVCVWLEDVQRPAPDTGRVVPSQHVPLEKVPSSIEFSPKGDVFVLCVGYRIVIFTFSKRFRRWLHNAEDDIEHLSANADFSQVVFSPHTSVNLLAASDTSGVIHLWDIDVDGNTSDHRTGLNSSVAHRLLRSGDAAVAPALRCIAFSPLRDFLMYTADEVGRLCVWMIRDLIPDDLVEHKQTTDHLALTKSASWIAGENDRRSTLLEEFSSNNAHDQAVAQLTCITRPIVGIISVGMENSVVISAWDGVRIAQLQQGPLASRAWCLDPGAFHYPTFKARVRWCRLRTAYATKELMTLRDVPLLPEDDDRGKALDATATTLAATHATAQLDATVTSLLKSGTRRASRRRSSIASHVSHRSTISIAPRAASASSTALGEHAAADGNMQATTTWQEDAGTVTDDAASDRAEVDTDVYEDDEQDDIARLRELVCDAVIDEELPGNISDGFDDEEEEDVDDDIAASFSIPKRRREKIDNILKVRLPQRLMQQAPPRAPVAASIPTHIHQPTAHRLRLPPKRMAVNRYAALDAIKGIPVPVHHMPQLHPVPTASTPPPSNAIRRVWSPPKDRSSLTPLVPSKALFSTRDGKFRQPEVSPRRR